MFNSIYFLCGYLLVFIVSKSVCVDSESHTLTPSIEVPQLCDKFSASHLLGTASLTCYTALPPHASSALEYKLDQTRPGAPVRFTISHNQVGDVSKSFVQNTHKCRLRQCLLLKATLCTTSTLRLLVMMILRNRPRYQNSRYPSFI